MTSHEQKTADLHVHSNYSDGTYTPEELVRRAQRAGLGVIALTDHDSVGGVARARVAGEEIGVEVVAGVEFGTPAGDAGFPEAHIVGLFIDPDCPELRNAVETWRALRCERAVQICEKLNGVGVSLRPDDVFALAGGGSVGRLHVAKALVANGEAATIATAFNRWIGADGPAYVPRRCASAIELIRLIHRSGGVAVLAHPKLNVKDDEIPAFADAGLDAVEVYSPEHTREDERRYARIAEELGLLAAGGSDCHGGNKETCALGSVRLEWALVEALRERAAEYAGGRRDG